MKLSVIIPSYNTAQLTLKCLKRVCSSFSEIKHEIILIDNHSEDESVRLVKKYFSRAKLIVNKKNFGFARAVNQGIRKARGEYVLLLNTDALVNKSLIRALKFLEQTPDVAMLSPRLTYPGGRLQTNFGNYPSLLTEILQTTLLYRILPWGRVIMPNILTRKKFYQSREVKWLSGTCPLIRASIFKRVGLFDEKFFMYLEDIDFCKRVKQAGFKIVFWGQTQIIHKHKASSKNSLLPDHYERKSLLSFWKKHYPRRRLSFQIIRALSGMKLYLKYAKI